jgi:hypothetical protein
MYNHVLGKAESLFEELTAGIDTSLPTVKLVDNMQDSAPGYSFLGNQNSHIRPLRFSLIKRKLEERWKIGIQHGQTVWNKAKVYEWMKKAHEFNQCLMLLMHISAQPARASELYTLLLRNQQNTHRALFWTPDSMIWILEYTKVNDFYTNYSQL